MKKVNIRLKNGSNEHLDDEADIEPPFHIALLCYLSIAILIIFGYIREFLTNIGLRRDETANEKDRQVINH